MQPKVVAHDLLHQGKVAFTWIIVHIYASTPVAQRRPDPALTSDGRWSSPHYPAAPQHTSVVTDRKKLSAERVT